MEYLLTICRTLSMKSYLCLLGRVRSGVYSTKSMKKVAPVMLDPIQRCPDVCLLLNLACYCLGSRKSNSGASKSPCMLLT